MECVESLQFGVYRGCLVGGGVVVGCLREGDGFAGWVEMQRMLVVDVYAAAGHFRCGWVLGWVSGIL